jgi:transcriptional regulator with XRE-family HTH domain
MQIGEAIRAAREAKGMDQGQLAEAVGAARETVSRWETGALRISRRSLLAVQGVLGMVQAKRDQRKPRKS